MRALTTFGIPAALFLATAPALAGPGFYIGGATGASDLTFGIEDQAFGETREINDDQVAWKLFAGYRFDTEPVYFAIEGGYSKLTDGDFIEFFPGSSGNRDRGRGLAGIRAAWRRRGPLGLFAKAGFVFWDASAFVPGVGGVDDSGGDLAWGLGVRGQWGRAELRPGI